MPCTSSMASILANGISHFAHTKTPKLSKGFYPKLGIPKSLEPKTHNSSLYKFRADVDYKSQTIESDLLTVKCSSSSSTEPKWSDNSCSAIDFQDICYYSEPKKRLTLNSFDEADPELIKYFDKLGVPLNEQNRLANVVY